MASADVLLHPVRLRIVQALLDDRVLTAADLRTELADVPPATLYRHLAVLVENQVLNVVAERRVRGAVERSYALIRAAAEVSADELARMTPAQHRAAFQAFVAGLLADFDAYTAGEDVDLARDIAGYRQVVLWLSRDEAMQMAADLNRVLGPLLTQRAATGRRRIALSSVLIPVGGPSG